MLLSLLIGAERSGILGRKSIRLGNVIGNEYPFFMDASASTGEFV